MIEEEIPTWSTIEGSVVWVESTVTVTPPASEEEAQYDALLMGAPHAAFVRLFPREAARAPSPGGIRKDNWLRHCLACRSVIYELCAAATRTELLSLLMEH